ncbi:MAG: heterodisulfide reductase-related iron-sulfur binding cluster [Nitrospirota bacterium]|nr:heterodisulfide reductase-related iron-sulfur binding cluster [Nitrospirota bacterium]
MLGWKELPFEVMQTGEFWYDLLKSGKIKIVRKIKESVTLQDPCNIIRRAGAAEKFRYFVNATCEDFREMEPNREHNYCCNAGGGLAAISNWAAHKARGNRVKAEQIKATGAKIVITPCHNCSTGIKDVVKFWNLGVKNIFFDEILVATMEIPEKFKVGE